MDMKIETWTQMDIEMIQTITKIYKQTERLTEIDRSKEIQIDRYIDRWMLCYVGDIYGWVWAQVSHNTLFTP